MSSDNATEAAHDTVTRQGDNATEAAQRQRDGQKSSIIKHWETKEQWVILGTLCYLSYIGLWITGLASPLIVVATLFAGFYWTALALTLAIALSFTPRSFYPVIPAMQKGYRFAALHYFRRSTMLSETTINKATPSIYCIHPHGIFCMGWAAMTLNPQLGHLTWCFSSVLEAAPFFRVFLRLLNQSLAGTSKTTIKALMRAKKSIGIIPGGFEEATLHCQSADRVYIKQRKGLFKYALQHGPYNVVPVYAFGEKDTYYNIQGMWKFRFWLNSLGIPAIVPFGAWFCPFLPRPSAEMTVVVGTPITLPYIPDPSKDDVAKWHGKYVEALKSLHCRHAASVYGPGKHTLELH